MKTFKPTDAQQQRIDEARKALADAVAKSAPQFSDAQLKRHTSETTLPREERNPPEAGRPIMNGAFANCAAARASGAARVRRGESGYGPHLDRDNDGVGCE